MITHLLPTALLFSLLLQTDKYWYHSYFTPTSSKVYWARSVRVRDSTQNVTICQLALGNQNGSQEGETMALWSACWGREPLVYELTGSNPTKHLRFFGHWWVVSNNPHVIHNFSFIYEWREHWRGNMGQMASTINSLPVPPQAEMSERSLI